jgi:hypothetical protein
MTGIFGYYYGVVAAAEALPLALTAVLDTVAGDVVTVPAGLLAPD